MTFKNNVSCEELNSCKVSKWSEYTDNALHTMEKTQQCLYTPKSKTEAEKNIFEDKDEVNLDTLLDI